MTRNEIDQNNIKFFQETVASEGFDGFRKWYDLQEDRIKDYYRSLLRLYTVEILDFVNEIGPKTNETQRLLAKYKTNPKVDK